MEPRCQSVPPTSSHTTETVRVEALANLPITDPERLRTTVASTAGAPPRDVEVPPSPRVPFVPRSSVRHAGRWRGAGSPSR